MLPAQETPLLPAKYHTILISILKSGKFMGKLFYSQSFMSSSELSMIPCLLTLQSASPSHFQALGMHFLVYLHWNWVRVHGTSSKYEKKISKCDIWVFFSPLVNLRQSKGSSEPSAHSGIPLHFHRIGMHSPVSHLNSLVELHFESRKRRNRYIDKKCIFIWYKKQYNN